MNDSYKKIVNLQAKEDEPIRKKIASKKAVTKKASPKSRASEIDHVFADAEDEKKTDFKKLERPIIRESRDGAYKNLTVILLFLFLASTLYFVFFGGFRTSEGDQEAKEIEGAWYAVELTDKETYYGYIQDTGSDPVVLENVYYNYNQALGQAEEEQRSSSIRLVKRGKEAHGPDGTMRIVRSQVLFMEPLREDSKILKAILEYEK